MEKRKYLIFDIETDGLLENVTKIHCLSYQILNETQDLIEKRTVYSKKDIEELFLYCLEENISIVGHNIICYDLPVLKKIYGIFFKKGIIDTLGLSWALFPERLKHGLESYGLDFEMPKIEISDWENLTKEDYTRRCERDVEINRNVFLKISLVLQMLYNDSNGIFSFINFISFRMSVLNMFYEAPLKFDENLGTNSLIALESEFNKNTKLLSQAMPKELGNVVKKKPKNLFLANGNLSKRGHDWFLYLKENDIDENIEEIREEPNPSSNTQLKKWLLENLSWKPKTFKISKSTGEKVPQIQNENGNLCDSVKILSEKEPSVELLDNYFLLKHRIGVFKSFFENRDSNNNIRCSAHSFTRTLRLTHSKPLVNLPKPGTFYGNEIRGSITVPNDSYTLCGADISGLEDGSKRHLIYEYDPEYVKEMNKEGFDAHLDIGILSGLITQEEADFYKYADGNKGISEEEKQKFHSIKNKRFVAKTSNFAMTYNAFPPKIAETAKIPLSQAQTLFDTYWKRNWAIKKISDNAIIKRVDGSDWVYNPVSGFWLRLKHRKDVFSTLNQGFGKFIFDKWLFFVLKEFIPLGINISLEYHDEILFYFDKNKFEESFIEKILRDCIKKTNKVLNLNVNLDISVSFGKNYKEVH